MDSNRTLDVVVCGTGGPAVVYHHGTPWAAESYQPLVTAATEAGLRWVSFSRPGYGSSTRRPGRSIADNCSDVRAVLTHLRVDQFVAVGWSGGGPHALACGALLAPQCAAVACVAGVAPLLDAEQAGLDWYDGMGPENHEEFRAALGGEAAVRAYLAPLRDDFTHITGDEVVAAFGGLVDDADKAVLTGGYAEAVAGSFRDAMRVSVDGWVDDDLAFTRDWGFDLSEVQVPVSLWQGTDDRMVPFAHGSYLADHLPDVRPHLVDGGGHMSVLLDRFQEMLREVRSFVG